MKKFLIISVLFLIMGNISCRKGSKMNPVKGTLHNMTGFDGCGWIIEVDKSQGGEVLEPTNLTDFGLVPAEGMHVKFSYRKLDRGSICMMGQVVELTSLEEK